MKASPQCVPHKASPPITLPAQPSRPQTCSSPEEDKYQRVRLLCSMSPSGWGEVGIKAWSSRGGCCVPSFFFFPYLCFERVQYSYSTSYKLSEKQATQPTTHHPTRSNSWMQPWVTATTTTKQAHHTHTARSKAGRILRSLLPIDHEALSAISPSNRKHSLLSDL